LTAAPSWKGSAVVQASKAPLPALPLVSEKNLQPVQQPVPAPAVAPQQEYLTLRSL
jgi:hypothetical protein